MRSEAKKAFYFQAHANSFGGFIEKPLPKYIPPQASASLPSVGGLATTRLGAFNHDEILSCSSSYAHVSGSDATVTGGDINEDGSWSIKATAVLENLNILEVVTADRVVSQITVDYPKDGGLPLISLAGSRFDNLRIGGFHARPSFHLALLRPEPGIDASQSQLTWENFRETGRSQAETLIRSVGIAGDADRKAFQWIEQRFQWMQEDLTPEGDKWALCSLVDSLDQTIPGRTFGHVVEIPDFGRVFLGEVIVTPSSVDLTMVRAELGCGVTGQTSAGHTGVGGHTVPPSTTSAAALTPKTAGVGGHTVPPSAPSH